MSDLSMFDTTLEHHTLEAIAWQFDGKKESAMAGGRALLREVPMRGGTITEMRHHIEAHTDPGRNGGNSLRITIVRVADDQEWEQTLIPGDWLVMWLHESRLHKVEVVDFVRGEEMFRPVSPVVTLRPRTDPADAPAIERAPTSVIRFPHGEDR
jgi:hypothetical protein